MTEWMPLYKELEQYGNSDYYPYHMPGHKRRQLGDVPERILKTDITEIDGFDNLHQAEGILREAQDSANMLYGAEETFYLVNGSTAGILSAISAALPESGHLLITRGCHKSVYHAAYLRKLKLSYLYLKNVKGFGFSEAVTAEQVQEALRRESDIEAVLIVSPTYEGRIADVKKIAEIVHEKGIPLIVDEAHGAHLGFAEGFAPGACMAGADIVIHSVHKTLPAMTQTALLHVNGTRVDRDRLKRFLRIYQTSSPSYVLMASISDAMEFLKRDGKRYFADFRDRYLRMLDRLGVCKVLQVVAAEDISGGRQDIGKLVIGAGNRRDISGQWLYDQLRERYHLQCEMAAGRYCLAMFTVADSSEAYERMEQALLCIDEELSAESGAENVGSGDHLMSGIPDKITLPEVRYPFSAAWDLPWKRERLGDAVGCAVGEFVNLYPPGVPILVPGEVLTQEIYEQILEYLTQKLNLQGLIQEEGEYYIRILRQ
ncbi:MAG: aminotransferase class I/II-fold pyridoxal phosphate-dependent enzyme [Lachnospiraceae bacterium]|nr:aminotransferase class I/II-fold pyridoxal phosphate-dependent enzyme [Lachnospiraceae bacterium]